MFANETIVTYSLHRLSQSVFYALQLQHNATHQMNRNVHKRNTNHSTNTGTRTQQRIRISELCVPDRLIESASLPLPIAIAPNRVAIVPSSVCMNAVVSPAHTVRLLCRLCRVLKQWEFRSISKRNKTAKSHTIFQRILKQFNKYFCLSSPS